MSKANNLKDFLVDLANAIREKKNKTGAINPQDFSAEILSIVAGDVQMPNVSGTLVVTEGITEEDYEALKLILGNNITIDAQGGIYIHFEDPEVLRVLLANITPNDGVGITTAQAEAVTSIRTWFKGNTTIETFDEFEKFSGVTSISASAFDGCTSMDSIILPSSLTSINDTAFRRCKFENKELFLKNITTIKEGAFNSTKLRSVFMPNIVTVGGAYSNDFTTFGFCPNLGLLYFGTNTQRISPYILTKSNRNVIMIITAEIPPTLGGDSLDYSGAPAAIYVPDTSVEAYKTATNWSAYAGRIFSISAYDGDLPEIPSSPTYVDVTSDYILEVGQAYGSVGNIIQFTDDTAYEHTKALISDVSYIMTKDTNIASSLVQYVDNNNKILKIAVTNAPSVLTRYEIENVEGATHVYLTSATGTLQIWKEMKEQ